MDNSSEGEWYQGGLKNINNDETLQIQLTKNCIHCVVGKNCTKHDTNKNIPRCFRNICRNPSMCDEVKRAMEHVKEIDSNFMHPKIPIMNTCVHNHSSKKNCLNCIENRTGTFMMNNKEFRYCYSTQLEGKNTICIGLHWDVIASVKNNKIEKLELIPFSKDNIVIQKKMNHYPLQKTFSSELNEKEFNLIKKENDLLRKEIEMIHRTNAIELFDRDERIQYLTEELRKVKNHLPTITKEELFKEIGNNINIIEEQFLKTEYQIVYQEKTE